MDVCESDKALHKYSAVVSPRPPLVPAEDKNNGTTRRSRTREVSSRYRSPTPLASSGTRRSPSPSITRRTTGKSSSVSAIPKRAISAERKRSSTPPSPQSPSSTPLHDTSMMDVQLLASKKIIGSRLPEVLWPSTMRSLSVSFQSDTFSLPIISKREKPVPHALFDRNLKPSSNVTHKQAVLSPPLISRKPTPERKRSPLKGKNSIDQSENSKPVVEDLHTRLVDQHRWPSGKVSSNALITDKRTTNTSSLRMRRMSLDGITSNKPLQKSAVSLSVSIGGSGRGKFETTIGSGDDNSLPLISSSSLERNTLITPAVRSQSLPTPGSRSPSANKAPTFSSSVSRGVSPSRARVLNPAPSRGSISPSQIRSSSPSRQSNNTTSVLSFIADIRKGKKVANHIEDAHQLRLLYNRHLQWRYANAQRDAVLYSQKVKSEKLLYSVWRTTSELWDSVTEKRIDLQQLRLKFKLYAILNGQMTYLTDWASIEKDHTSSLSRSIEDLQASTLRLPVNGGARADIETIKAAVCSAVDVLQAMGSSICSTLSRVEGMNCLVSEFADMAAQARAMLNECEALLASAAAMQVEEYSLRTHLMQLKQTWNIYGN